MELNHFAKGNPSLAHLLQQSRHFLILDRKVKALFPQNLSAYFNVACVQDGVLVLMAKNGMAASRLKMMLPMLLAEIQNLDAQIVDVKIRVQPENPVVPREKQCHFSETVLANFEQTAQQLNHAPELAQALLDLVAHHRQEQA